MRKAYLFALLLLLTALPCLAQADKADVRKGNRRFKKENYKEAEIDYRKALVKDSTSFAALYDLASSLYEQKDYDGAASALEPLKEQAAVSKDGDKYYFNLGDAALQKKDYSAAVEAFKQSLLRSPDDMDAKESYLYAKLMLQNQQQDGGGGQDNQNQDQDQNQEQDQNQDRDQNQNQNQDQNQDPNQNQNQDQNQNQVNQDQGEQPEQQSISPQQAKQMLSAMQAKEKETQQKVEKEKAAALKSRQKEKNW